MKTPRITDEQVAHWLEHDYVVIPGFLTTDELAASNADLRRYYPSADEYFAAPERYRTLPGMLEFPYVGDALNHVATHPDLLDFVGEILGTPDVFLTQSLLWGKYSGGQYDQALHRDYGNNTLVVPRDDGAFRQVAMIIYYEDVTDEHGPTRVVSQRFAGEVPLVPAVVTIDERPDLYANEHAVTATAGSLLLYSEQTLHRGSEFRAPKGARFSHHLVYRAAGYEWMGFQALPREGNSPEMRRFIEVATPRQRSAIGFPAPGHAYWNDATLDGVALRYPKMDLGPYREAANCSTSTG